MVLRREKYIMSFHLFFLTITLEKRVSKQIDRQLFMQQVEGKGKEVSARDEFRLGLYQYLERW